jgi:hypothetical protein
MPLSGATVSDDENRWLVPTVRTTPALRQATRARLPVAPAALLLGRDVDFVDFDRIDEVEGRGIERFARALDAPVHLFVCHLNFAL